MMSLLLLIAAIHGPGLACDRPTHSQELQTTLDLAEAAYGQGDLVSFTAAGVELQALVACLDQAPKAPTVARLHRLMGLHHATEGALGLAEEAFAAARRLAPDARFDTAVVPPDHAIHGLFMARPTHPVKTTPVPAPTSGSLLFDTFRGTERPVTAPSLVQVMTDSGQVETSRYLLPNDPMPPYPGGPGTHPGSPEPSGWPEHRSWLLGGATAAGAGSAAMYLAAQSRGQTWSDPDTTGQARLDQLRRQHNGLLTGSALTGALAAGLGLTLALTW